MKQSIFEGLAVSKYFLGFQQTFNVLAANPAKTYNHGQSPIILFICGIIAIACPAALRFKLLESKFESNHPRNRFDGGEL